MHAENSKRPLLDANSTSWRRPFLLISVIFGIILLVYALQDYNSQTETPISAPQFTFKRGSEETKEWLQIYHQRLVAAWKFADKRNMFSMQKSHGYMDIMTRVKNWIAWADQPDFIFFYLYDRFDDNVQAAAGVKIFRTGELMQRVKKYGRRDFEARINSQYCESTPDTRPPWIYLDDIFSHDIAYMVGIHKFPTVDTPQLANMLVPYMFETINGLVDTDIWEYWVPRPLGRMPENFRSLGFKSTLRIYDKADGTSFANDWMYNAFDFVAAFNEFVVNRNDVPRGQLIILSRQFSFARLGNKTDTRL